MLDNGINVIVGQRDNSNSWERAKADGFVPGKTLLPIEEAAGKGTVVAWKIAEAPLETKVKPHVKPPPSPKLDPEDTREF